MAFGKPIFICQLDPQDTSHLTWDEAVEKGSEEYCHRMVPRYFFFTSTLF
jgi:hypothetical protein